MKKFALVGLVCFLAGCGAGGDPDLVFQNHTPHTEAAKPKIKNSSGEWVWQDNRAVEARCPSPTCQKPVGIGDKYCSDTQRCGVGISWQESYPCGWCKATGVCPACYYMEQPDGDCFSCRGMGLISYEGTSYTCRNCKDTKKCPICTGHRRCDMCDGEGKLTHDLLEKHQKEKEPFEE